MFIKLAFIGISFHFIVICVPIFHTPAITLHNYDEIEVLSS